MIVTIRQLHNTLTIPALYQVRSSIGSSLPSNCHDFILKMEQNKGQSMINFSSVLSGHFSHGILGFEALSFVVIGFAP